VSDLLGSWRGQFGTRHALQIWRLAPLCLMWCLWRERNERSFEDRESDLLEIKKIMLQSLFAWKVALNSVHVSTALC
jgi:hypothetical protein